MTDTFMFEIQFTGLAVLTRLVLFWKQKKYELVCPAWYKELHIIYIFNIYDAHVMLL